MRIDTKLNALQSVTENGQFTLEHEYILNNQYVKIQNWSDVCTALQVLREVDWMGDDHQRQLLNDYLENRGEGETLELPSGEFNELLQAVQRYNSGLDIILNTLRAHAVSTSTDTIWVEIRSASDPGELAEIVQDIERTLNIAGQVGASFRFAGVAQGTDWLGFIPNSELVGIALDYCISLAASISVELLKTSGPMILAFARRDLRSRSEDDSLSQEAVNETLRRVKEEASDIMIDEGVQKFIEHLASSDYPETNQHQIAEAMKVATSSIQKMAETDTARFEVSERGKNITISIHGDNNPITINNFPEIPRHSEALPAAEPNSESNGD